MAAGNEMRVSDAEREAAASELREHFASGRLDSEELNERLDRAFAAKTRGDLNALFTDLPSSWRSPSSAFGPGAQAGPGGQAGSDERWQYAGRRAGAGVGLLLFLMPVLMVFGILSVFGIGGGGRPIGIVLILAAFALLRRLLFMIMGRRGRRGRGGGGSRGPRRRRR
jgi:hypothetical protein